MTENDVLLVEALNGLIPVSDETGSWERVLADAGMKPGRPAGKRRLVAIAAALIAGAVAPLTAVAVVQGWWFFAAGAPAPKSPVVIVDRESFAGVEWALTAYAASDGRLCVGLTRSPGASLGPAQAGSGLSCASVGANDTITSLHFVQLAATQSDSGETTPEIIFGSVPSSVARVKVVRVADTPVTAATVSAPASLGITGNLFLASIPLGSQAQTLQVIDSGGAVLSAVTLANLGVSTTGSRGVSWGS